MLFNFPEGTFPEYAWPGHEGGGPFFPKRSFPNWAWPKTGITEVRSVAITDDQREFVLDDDEDVLVLLANLMRAINA